MILVLTLFSARWATKITGSIRVLNDFVNNLKIAQDKDDKNEVVSKISENPAFTTIARQYKANIALDTFRRNRDGSLISNANAMVRRSIGYESSEVPNHMEFLLHSSRN